MSNQSYSVSFEHIDLNQKGKTIYESKITVKAMEDGKEVIIPFEETKFINQKYSGFAPQQFISDPAKRDFIKIDLDSSQQGCTELKEILSKYDDGFHNSNMKSSFSASVSDCVVVYNNSVKLLESKEEGKEYCKMKMKMNWFYYYDNKRLDKSNSDAVRKTVSEYFKANPKASSANKDKKKELIMKLDVNLKFKNEDGEEEELSVNMSKIEQRKEFDTKIFYRKLENLPNNYKKPYECTEEELVMYYGDPGEPLDIRTPDQFDEIYGHKHKDGYKHHNYYIRLIFVPAKLWASKNKTIIQCGITYVINYIDIIHLPNENNYSSTQRVAYGKYAFGKKSVPENLLINDSSDSSDTPLNQLELTGSNTNANANTSTKNLNVDSNSDDSGDSESGESDESGDSDESEESDESESEEVAPVVNSTKSTKQTANTPVVSNNSKTVVEAKPVEAKPAKSTSSKRRT